MILFYSFIVSLFATYFLIKFLKKIDLSQPIYNLAPKEHIKKMGTPTMGGIGFLFVLIAALIYLFFLYETDKLTLIIFLVVTCGFGYIGFKDDFLKIRKKNNQEGLTPKQKLILQFLISIFVILSLYLSGFDTSLSLFNHTIELGILYYILVPIFIVGYSNAFNITDGLDGLLSSNSILLFSYASLISYTSNNDLLLFVNLSIVGSLIGFLCFNFFPAKIFMGDTGSLALGALFAVDMVLLNQEFTSFVISGFILFELLSVVVQVCYFKYTKKQTGSGKRIFLKAPFHHHLEALGFSEIRVVFMSLFVTFLLIVIVVLS